jgi:membrane peptidoglycan carboxypeptidase
MQELNVITAKQANDAIRTPVYDPKKVQEIPNGCASSKYPFYCEYVVSKLLENPAFGKTKKEAEHYIKTAGITVKTSLDPKTQRAAEAAIKAKSKPTDTAVAAITMVQPGSGLIKGMAQSKPYGNGKNSTSTSYNYNVEKTYPGGYGGFQIGSTMKAFTIAAAIQQGIPLNYRINSPAQMFMGNLKFKTCTGTTRDPEYRPKNSTSAAGNLTMIQAAQASTNTYFLQLSQRTGLCSIATLAAKLGLKDAQNGQPLQQVISMTLGIDNVSPLMLSNAYATFAARGKYCKPLAVTAITSAAGKPIKTPGIDCEQVLAQPVADGVNRVLHEVMEPPGTGSKLKFGTSDLAGKTGTIQDNKAVWYSGYSSTLAAAAVVADASVPYTDLMRGHTLNGKDIADASGSGTAGPIWETAMKAALRGTPETHFVPPNDKTVRGDVKNLPFVNGMSVQDATNKLQGEGFQVTLAPGTVDSEEAAGTVAYTTPRQRDGAPEGSLVTLHISNGSKSQNPPPPPNTPQPPNPPNTVKPPNLPQCPPWHPKYPNCGGGGR